MRKDALEENLGRAYPEILGRVLGQLIRRRLKVNTASYSAKLCKKDGFRDFEYSGADNDKLYPPCYRHKHQNPNTCVVCGECLNQNDEVCVAALNSPCTKLGYERSKDKARAAA
jgi:hypothetical protein